MNYSRRQLEQLGEPLGDAVTRCEAGRMIYGGGGGSSFSNGWRYFSDGTAIDPSGNYYSGGALVWSR